MFGCPKASRAAHQPRPEQASGSVAPELGKVLFAQSHGR
ncbi:hypothetical protein NSU_2691 [Novosphingobium pentaromativorans US6-1]|uniref:Uncharacterized protein n=1 Tax=Novosphingobium pentaromativorans US6-1 TaxID=1088721 RepID=G6EEC0_9SPHN|nr:hypothetical protein NSU_2691 [Novosphingobium pentaromativorans US6-1]